ncbi:MFS transporter [Acidianus sp. HS-5]|uniref:MFS transporter n=1 Tax=Acidianus sp. HS-5 TaxID=2886040 RepID=UPI001F02925C|nr:MFS transporter [Acidianus sp. HS-5]BDC17827.1 MFS transporter [Acidianus sp. HS-5]
MQKLRSFFVSSAGFFLDGYDLSVISFALYFITEEMRLNSSEEGLVSSASLIGMTVGALIFGFLADKVGRKKLMGIDLIFFMVFGITSALSQDFTQLFISRLLLGIGIGGDYPVSSTIMSEFSPARSRGKYLVAAISLYWVGTLIASVANLTFLGLYEFWRYTFLFGALISLPIIILRIKLDESPRWLASKGLLANKELNTEIENKGVNGIKELFKNPLLPYVLAVSSVWFLFDVASYGIGLYYPLVLKEFAFPSNVEVLYSTMAIAVGALLGYLIAVSAIDSLGRRKVLLIGLGGMASLLVLGGVTMIKGAVLVPYFMSFVALEQWAGAVTLFYPTEIFPTSVRSTAQGFATSVSRIGAILGVYFFPSMVHSLGFSASLIVFGITSVVAFALSFITYRETKRKELEETTIGKILPASNN